MDGLSLCTGYGGLDLAVEAVLPDAVTRWVSDIDSDAVAVQAARFPDAIQLGDLKQIDWSSYAGQVDVMTAGYPCQPFSQAGQRKGVDDDRHLWPWVADAIRLVGPRLVVLENVAGHLGVGFDAVLGDLAAMGRTVRWGVVRASDAGAPHRRERLFVVAVDAANTESADWREAQQPGMATSTRRAAEPRERHRHTAANTDGTGPQRAEPARRRDVPPRGVAASTDGTAGIGRPGLPAASERQGSPSSGTADWKQFGPAIRRWETVMGRAAPAPIVPGTKQLNARMVEWMMGLPEGWVTDLIPNRRALKVLGNGVVPQQAALAIRGLL